MHSEPFARLRWVGATPALYALSLCYVVDTRRRWCAKVKLSSFTISSLLRPSIVSNCLHCLHEPWPGLRPLTAFEPTATLLSVKPHQRLIRLDVCKILRPCDFTCADPVPLDLEPCRLGAGDGFLLLSTTGLGDISTFDLETYRESVRDSASQQVTQEGEASSGSARLCSSEGRELRKPPESPQLTSGHLPFQLGLHRTLAWSIQPFVSGSLYGAKPTGGSERPDGEFGVADSLNSAVGPKRLFVLPSTLLINSLVLANVNQKRKTH